VSPVKYEVGFYIPEDDILHSHRRENLKPYIALLFSTYVTSKPHRNRTKLISFQCSPTSTKGHLRFFLHSDSFMLQRLASVLKDR
jgi:hypothetical protein